MITMICFFIVAIIQLVIGALARSNCRDTGFPLNAVACGNGWRYFFALMGEKFCSLVFRVLVQTVLQVILLFTSVIGAAAAFSFWRMLRQEDEGGDKYVYLAEAVSPENAHV